MIGRGLMDESGNFKRHTALMNFESEGMLLLECTPKMHHYRTDKRTNPSVRGAYIGAPKTVLS